MQLSHALFARRRGATLAVAAIGVAVATTLSPAGTAQATTHLAATTRIVSTSVHPLNVTTAGATRAAALADSVPPPVSSTCSAGYESGDRRLGPQTLPTSGTVGWELKGYRRTGALTAADFLAAYYDSAANSWIYPPQNGYQLGNDGAPIVWRKTLKVGRELDRFGSEYGAFLSPAGTPYAERAIPPSNLAGTPAEGCNYRRYQVAKAFDVAAGPIAAWFGQRGDGWQYQLSSGYVSGAPATLNVLWLVDNGYLVRVS